MCSVAHTVESKILASETNELVFSFAFHVAEHISLLPRSILAVIERKRKKDPKNNVKCARPLFGQKREWEEKRVEVISVFITDNTLRQSHKFFRRVLYYDSFVLAINSGLD